MIISDKEKIVAALVILGAATTNQISELLKWPDRKRVSRRMKELLERGIVARTEIDSGGYLYTLGKEEVVHGRRKKRVLPQTPQLNLFK